MLCLLTLADVEAVSPETLTPWKEELLWRLYVDTYNHLTLGYGDELIEHAGRGRPELLAAGPPDLAGERDRRVSSRGCRGATCSCSIARRSTATCGCRATSIRTKCTLGLEPQDAAWELTVVTLDKPFLFSNICGVLSSFGMDILRGHAMTNPNGLVLDVVPVHRPGAVPRAQRRRAATQLLAACSRTVVSGRVDVDGAAARRGSRACSAAGPCAVDAGGPLSTTRRRSAIPILEIIADDALGLLLPDQPRRSRSTAATSTWC